MEDNKDTSLGTILHLKFNVEKTQNEGEDADPILVECSSSNRFIIAVADGMGGSGSTKYEYNGELKTGAYFSSRTTIQTCKDFFIRLFENNLNLKNDFPNLKIYIKERLIEKLKKFKYEASGLKSKLIRILPTTLACIYMEKENEKTRIGSIWAGDSRNYILTASKGLQQISIDDLKEDLDPFENLQKDSQLKNFISVDNEFVLNFRELEITGYFIAIVATDGCFGYFSTPMQFEYELLQCLETSESINDWEKLLINSIKEVAGDDFSMLILVMGWDNDFNAMKAAFKQRKNLLYKIYISSLLKTEKTIQKLKIEKNKLEKSIKDTEIGKQFIQKLEWDNYKKSYCEILNEIL